MSNTDKISIKRNMTRKDLDKKIKDLEKEVKLLERLKFITYRYDGYSVKEASDKVGVTKRVGYIWQDRWNEEGYDGLKPKYKGGRPSQLTEKQKIELKDYLLEKNNWTTHEVKNIIKEKYNIEFTEKHVRTILHQFNLM